jgi:cysteinyl-tRNA synthetase
MSIRFYNTLSRSIEEFIPLKKGEASLYTCGPTVYNYPHIGNLRTFIFEDLLHRWLSCRGYKVKRVMNLTDVDDKTIKNSIQQKMALADYTQIYKKAFFEDIEGLFFLKADFYPAATDYIKEMIEIIQGLIKKGFAYESNDGVYFKVSAFADYGKLAHIDQETLLAGASGRLSTDEYSKEQVSDFALWKKWTAEDGAVKWDSPFGEGRPGWHIECSAMSMKLLGETLDIHCGGVDNIFPHHENEIAQSEAYTGKPFVHYWLHAVHLVVDGEKMAKSKGNFHTLRDLTTQGYTPRAVRYALITTHYRKPLNFSFDLLKQADSSLKRIDDFVFALKNVKNEGSKNEEFSGFLVKSQSKFESSLDEDLNISEAMAALFELISHYYENQKNYSRQNAVEILSFLEKADTALGFIHKEVKEELSDEEKALMEERNLAKKNKDFKKSDEIRDILLKKGIELRDTKEGLVWKRL